MSAIWEGIGIEPKSVRYYYDPERRNASNVNWIRHFPVVVVRV